LAARKASNISDFGVINDPVKSITIVNPSNPVDPYRDGFNHRAIEVAPPIPIKTLGRKAPMERKPEVEDVVQNINNNPINILLNEDHYGRLIKYLISI